MAGVSRSSAHVGAASAPSSLSFRGTTYTQRWSQGSQYEFTPSGQEDLNAWTDMITVILYPSATDGDGLAGVANNVLGLYQKNNGKILRTNSVPATAQKPAEHFIAAVLPDPKLLEFVAARFFLSGKTAAGIVYSHRVYGAAAGNPMSEWLGPNGPEIESKLMALETAPVLKAVGK